MRITAAAPKAACRCFLLIYMSQKKQRKPDMRRRFRTKSDPKTCCKTLSVGSGLDQGSKDQR